MVVILIRLHKGTNEWNFVFLTVYLPNKKFFLCVQNVVQYVSCCFGVDVFSIVEFFLVVGVIT